jgi:hypothetical protein
MTDIDKIKEMETDAMIDALCKEERRADDGGLEGCDYSGDIKAFHWDAGDICLPEFAEDSETLRGKLRDALYWIELECKHQKIGPRAVKDTFWHNRVMAERLAVLGERIALAAWDQGYRARHFEKRTEA